MPSHNHGRGRGGGTRRKVVRDLSLTRAVGQKSLNLLNNDVIPEKPGNKEPDPNSDTESPEDQEAEKNSR